MLQLINYRSPDFENGDSLGKGDSSVSIPIQPLLFLIHHQLFGTQFFYISYNPFFKYFDSSIAFRTASPIGGPFCSTHRAWYSCDCQPVQFITRSPTSGRKQCSQ